MTRTDLRQRLGGGPGLLIIATLAVIVAALAIVAHDTSRLEGRNETIMVAQARAAALNNFSRSVLKLRQGVLEYGVADRQGASAEELATKRENVRVQEAVCVRQLRVAELTYVDGVDDREQIARARTEFAAMSLEGVLDDPTAKASWYADQLTELTRLERLIEYLRGNSEVHFYAATVGILDSNARSQIALVMLFLAVAILGGAVIVVLIRRRRNEVAVAYEALKEEMGERRAAEAALRASEGRFRSLVQRASDLTLVTDASGLVSYASPAVEGILGLSPEAMIGRPITEQLHPDDRGDAENLLLRLASADASLGTVELRMATATGQFRVLEALCRNLIDDPEVGGVVWNGRDVTDRKLLADELEHQARHDSLTALPNRALFSTRLDELLREPDRAVSVILVDLDGFKNVNDTLGHPAGDELLQRASERLRGCLFDGDVVARLGGDEFAIMVDGASERAVEVARQVVTALAGTVSVAGRQLTVGASLGVAHRDGSASSADLLRDADIAMYVAKQAGKGRFEEFVPAMRQRAAYRSSLQQDLVHAVARGQIEVMYQPVLDAQTCRPIGLEALARWRHPERNLIGPVEFIPIAEEFGMIHQIGREVLRQACREGMRWRRLPGYESLCVGVNVSLSQVLAGDLVAHVQEALAESGLPAQSLTLEITESLADDSEGVSPEFARLKQLGVRLALDDFGSGYSSLEFLMRIGADVVKVDRTLLDFDTHRDGSMVRAIAHLGHTLGQRVVVEGVETAEHLCRARQAGCDLVQGYLFARPLPADQVIEYLTSQVSDGAIPAQRDGHAGADMLPAMRAG